MYSCREQLKDSQIHKAGVPRSSVSLLFEAWNHGAFQNNPHEDATQEKLGGDSEALGPPLPKNIVYDPSTRAQTSESGRTAPPFHSLLSHAHAVLYGVHSQGFAGECGVWGTSGGSNRQIPRPPWAWGCTHRRQQQEKACREQDWNRNRYASRGDVIATNSALGEAKRDTETRAAIRDDTAIIGTVIGGQSVVSSPHDLTQPSPLPHFVLLRIVISSYSPNPAPGDRISYPQPFPAAADVPACPATMPGILPMKVIKVGGTGSQSRIAQACDRCRSKKIRCDGVRPCCTQCANVGFECRTSDKLSRRAFPRGYTESLEERVRALETEVKDLKDLLDEKDEKIDVLSRIHSFSPSQRAPSAQSPPTSRTVKSPSSDTGEGVIHVERLPSRSASQKPSDNPYTALSSTQGFAGMSTSPLFLVIELSTS